MEKKLDKKELDKLVGFKKPREDIQIVYAYAKVREIKFENKQQEDSFIKRNIRTARLLVGYPLKRIIAWCRIMEYLPFDWTLETIGKYIDKRPMDVIIKYREKDYDKVFSDLIVEGILKWEEDEVKIVEN